jgi:GNAT superfamily N-acetyltransferase
LQIVPLVEHPELVDQVAAWGFAEWGHLNPGQTLQSRTAWIRERMKIDRIPIVLVARDDAGPMVGTASLLFDDLEGDPRNPWLASVFVPAEQRGKGIASALVVAIEDTARRLGYPTLYLFTTSAARLYAGLGWRALERREYRGEHIQVMDKAL